MGELIQAVELAIYVVLMVAFIVGFVVGALSKRVVGSILLVAAVILIAVAGQSKSYTFVVLAGLAGLPGYLILVVDSHGGFSRPTIAIRPDDTRTTSH